MKWFRENAPDAVPIDPSKLNQAQRLEAMNQLGKTALPGHRWRYDFSPEHVLEVQTRKPGGERHAFRTSLCSVNVDIRHERQKDIYEVRSIPKSMSSHTEHLLLQSATHFDAAFMRGLLRSMQSVCSNSMPHRLMP